MDRAIPGDQRATIRKVTDEWGRDIHAETLTANGVTSVDTEYDNLDRPVAKTLPYRSVTGEKIKTYYDSLGRVIRTESPGPTGTLVQETDPATLYKASFTATGSGRLTVGYATEQTKPNGQKVYEYKSNDRPIQTEYQTSVSTDGSISSILWNRIRYHYDYNDRLIAITRGTGSSKDSISDNPALTSTFEYNGYGQKIASYDPDKGTTRYSYDDKQRPLCTEYPDGKITCNKYDAYGRVTGLFEGGTDGNQIAEYRYSESESAYAQGKLSYVKDEAGEKRIHYDALTGKPSKIERTYKVNGSTKYFDIEQAYDITGALMRRKFPQTDMALYYIYHPEGSLKEIQLEDPNNRVVSNGTSATVLTTDAPDAMGLSPAMHYGNGVSIEAERNAAGSLVRMTASGADGVQAQYAYVYNQEGMILGKNDELKIGGIDRSETFKYDITRRMVEATGPYGTAASPIKTQTYLYGADGQPIRINGNSVSYSTENAHRMKSAGDVSYSYDTEEGPGRGLVTRRHESDNTQTEYSYNWKGMLSSVRNITPQGEIRSEFTYDSTGNRFYRSSQYDGKTIDTYDLADDYRIHTEDGKEYHTLEVKNNGQRIARFRFMAYHHTAMAPASGDLYLARASIGLDRIARLDGGLSNLPGLIAIVGENTYLAARQADIEWIHMAYLAYVASAVAAVIMLLLAWYRAGWMDLSWMGRTIHKLLATGLSEARPEPAGRSGLAQQIIAIIRNTNKTAGMAIIRNTDKTPGTAITRNTNITHDAIITRTPPPPLYLRLTGISLALSIFAVSCVNSNGGQDLIIPPGGGGSYSSSGGNSDSTILGAYYYISTHNGSTDLVTDARGKVVARFAYDPFGNVVNDLTDLDADGNREFYKGTFYFTGQEYELETGLYNYKARTYDPKTGRFLQPDPVHTSKAGMDNFDRYQYVYNNPVNYTDPDGRKACSKQVNAAAAFMVGGPFLTGAVGVVGNYTGGGGNCTTRMPREKEALLLLLYPYSDLRQPELFVYSVLFYYENYMKGNGPSFLGKMNNTDLQIFLIGQLGVVQDNDNPGDDMFPVLAYFLMREMVAKPRSGVDKASFYHDQYGPKVLDRKNRKATSRWIKDANRATFSHDSWSRTYKREKKATPKWWGDARNGVATLNTIGTWTADAVTTITGTVLFSVANAITGTKNLDKPKKWRL